MNNSIIYKYRNQVEERIYKLFSPLKFYESNHTYRLDSNILPSVSKLVSNHAYPFDKEKWLKICARKEQITEQELDYKWKTYNKERCDLGTNTHKFMEEYDGYQVPNSPYEEAGIKYIKSLEGEYIVSFRELRAFSRKYMYAGTMDLPLENIRTGNYIIDDYKTNKDLFKSYDFLKPPFQYLENSPFNKYQLQLSYYQIMLEEAGLVIENRRIIYLKEDGEFTIYPLWNFTNELRDYLENKN